MLSWQDDPVDDTVPADVNETPEDSPVDQVHDLPEESADATPQPSEEEPVEPEAPTYRRFDLHEDEDEAFIAAQAAIVAGECIVMPTDTVYGIGANAFSADAVQGLLNAKHRGRDMPPPVLIAEPAMLPALGTDVPEKAKLAAERFWPGALTIIVTMQPALRLDLGDTRGTIALRVPDHDAARTLLRRTGPLAVSSANISGHEASTSIDDAVDQLGNSVSVYLDAGPTPGPVPSTIIDFVSTPEGRIVRQGAVSLKDLQTVLPDIIPFQEPAAEEPPAEEPPAEQTPDQEADEPAPTGEEESAPHETSEEQEPTPAQDEPVAEAPAGEEPTTGPATEPEETAAAEPSDTEQADPEHPVTDRGDAAASVETIPDDRGEPDA